MPSVEMNYSHPTYTVIRQESKTAAVTAAGGLIPLTFRSKVACVVTGIYAIAGGSINGTTSAILTLLFNNSVRAVLTLNSSINKVIESFTLTANQTMTNMIDNFRVSSSAAISADTEITVIYEYKIVPGAVYSVIAVIA